MPQMARGPIPYASACLLCQKYISEIDRQQFPAIRKQIKIECRGKNSVSNQHRNRILQIAIFRFFVLFKLSVHKYSIAQCNEEVKKNIGQCELLLLPETQIPITQKTRSCRLCIFGYLFVVVVAAAFETTSRVRNGNFSAFRLQSDALAACTSTCASNINPGARWYWKINSPFSFRRMDVRAGERRTRPAKNIEIERNNLLFARKRISDGITNNQVICANGRQKRSRINGTCVECASRRSFPSPFFAVVVVVAVAVVCAILNEIINYLVVRPSQTRSNGILHFFPAVFDVVVAGCCCWQNWMEDESTLCEGRSVNLLCCFCWMVCEQPVFPAHITEHSLISLVNMEFLWFVSYFMCLSRTMPANNVLWCAFFVFAFVFVRVRVAARRARNTRCSGVYYTLSIIKFLRTRQHLNNGMKFMALFQCKVHGATPKRAGTYTTMNILQQTFYFAFTGGCDDDDASMKYESFSSVNVGIFICYKNIIFAIVLCFVINYFSPGFVINSIDPYCNLQSAGEFNFVSIAILTMWKLNCNSILKGTGYSCRQCNAFLFGKQ